MSQLKLFMLLLGCKPPGRHTEQHDVFFGIATSLHELVAEIKAFWPEPERIHIDAWREINTVDDWQITISERSDNTRMNTGPRLFFINLGGYLPDRFEEQHYMLLTAKHDRAKAMEEAKQTTFFRHNHFEGANSHIDDKYGVDVDDIYEIEDILSANQKARYHINISPANDLVADPIHLGYLKLSVLEKASTR
jgi:hypothetical protein